MSAATASNIRPSVEDAEVLDHQSVPNVSKESLGMAMQSGQLPTPEPTPEPEAARIEANRTRSSATANDAADDNATANKPLNDNDELGTEDTSGGEGGVIQDILKCGKDEHRKVLGIGEPYTNLMEEEKRIMEACWNRGMETHPRETKDKDAQKAFERVLEAGQALGCDEVVEDLKDWEVSDDDNDQDRMEIDGETPALTPKTVKLYQEATPHISHLQQMPTSKAASQELEKINDRIKEMNKKDGVTPVEEWTIDYQKLAEYYGEALPFIRRVKKNSADDEAFQKFNEVNKALGEFIEKRKYLDWKLDPKVVLPKVSPKPATEWKPGFTEKGERILAMAPTESTDVLGNPVMTRCLFLVEKKGEKNPIAFEDAADIGEKAARGYLEQLPKTERMDVRTKANSFSPKDRQGVVGIKGVAAKDGDNPNRYPDCAVWVEYEDGSYKIPNRTGCRAIWKSKADRMIEDFFLDNGLEIPWIKRAKRPYQTDVPKGRSTGTGNSRTREAPWRARTTERGRSSSSPDRKRSSSTSSSDSYFGDEGLERLEDIEQKMSKFEALMTMMNQKLDAMGKKT